MDSNFDSLLDKALLEYTNDIKYDVPEKYLKPFVDNPDKELESAILKELPDDLLLRLASHWPALQKWILENDIALYQLFLIKQKARDKRRAGILPGTPPEDREEAEEVIDDVYRQRMRHLQRSIDWHREQNKRERIAKIYGDKVKPASAFPPPEPPP